MSDDGEGDLEGLDDALGELIARKTHAEKKTIKAHTQKLALHDEAIAKLLRGLDDKVDKTAYTREMEGLNANTSEALKLAREARTEMAVLGPSLRDEISRYVRDELASGLAAQLTLTTAQATQMAELHAASAGHEGRLAAAEIKMRTMEEQHRAQVEGLEARLTDASGSSSAQTNSLQERLSEALAALEAAKLEGDEGRQERERLAAAIETAAQKVASMEQAHQSELRALQNKVDTLSATLTQYLGIEATAVAKFASLKPSRSNGLSPTDGQGAHPNPDPNSGGGGGGGGGSGARGGGDGPPK